MQERTLLIGRIMVAGTGGAGATARIGARCAALGCSVWHVGAADAVEAVRGERFDLAVVALPAGREPAVSASAVSAGGEPHGGQRDACVELAAALQSRGTPVLFCGAAADAGVITLERARAARALGFLAEEGSDFEWHNVLGMALRCAAAERGLAQALSYSLSTLNATLEASTDAVIAIDQRRGLVHANSRFHEIFDTSARTPADRVGMRRQTLTKVLDPAHLLELYGVVDTFPDAELRGLIETLDGRRYDLHSKPLVAPDGCIGRVWGLRDVTEQQRSDEQIKALNAGLEKRVAERTAELAAARDDAERLSRAKGDFLANMSHEIRTPLHAVLGLAGIGLRESNGSGSGATFQRILDWGEHLLGVINNILDISKVDAGKEQLEQRPFKLAEVVGKAEEFVALVAQKKKLDLNVTLEPGLPQWVRGDALRLQQILVNLLGNAIKFTDRGGVRLTVRRQSEQEGERTCFEVVDSGIGIDAANLGKLFTPFEQLDGSSTRRFGGTGLGLMLSQSLATLMGGEIAVQSRLGWGSTFTLSLPLMATQALSTPGAVDEMPADGERLRGVRVLAVDDIDINRMILEDLLQSEGAHALIVDGAAAALQCIAEVGADGFDVVLMDIQMPEMDGYEAARRIRAMAPQLPVIGLTAHALAEERDRSLAAGMAEHVTKPVDATTLVRAIRTQVAARALALARSGPPGLGHSWMPSMSGALPDVPPLQDTPTGARRAATAAQAHLVIDWVALNARYAALPGFVGRLAGKALATQGTVPGQLRAAARGGDLRAVLAIVHDVTGLAGHLAAHELHDLARATEAAYKGANDGAAAIELACRLADGVDELLRELQEQALSEASTATA
jgi:signal transduction histidine kinase/DNA-binding response OmpR family regulator